jgi:hypothetical protein
MTDAKGPWKDYTTDPTDERFYHKECSTAFFWMPDLERMLNMPRLRQYQCERREAYAALVRHFKRTVVERMVVKAQNESKDKEKPSCLITMPMDVKNSFAFTLRQLMLPFDAGKITKTSGALKRWDTPDRTRSFSETERLLRLLMSRSVFPDPRLLNEPRL